MLKTEDLNTMISIDEIHFADWQIWPQLRILLHRGKPVRISARAFDVLVVLVSARGKAVSKESLLTQVWGNEIVEENNLQAQISAIRRILGHDRHLLVTEFGCGYRFNINKSPTEPLSKSKIPEPAITPFLASILGRDKAVQELCALLDQYRLVTITGSGGVGRLVWHGKSSVLHTRIFLMEYVWLNWLTSPKHPACYPLFHKRSIFH